MTRWAFVSRTPSMMLPWFSSSVRIASPSPASWGMSPAFPAKPLMKNKAASTLEAGDPPLEFLMEVHVARDRPDAPTPGAVGLDSLPSGPLDLRVVREVQVVVRTEHDHALAVHHAPRRRRSLEDAESPVQALGDERLVLRAHPPGRISLRHR